MADNLTPQQRKAVTDRGGKLLVSAAAGSGKTKVLVDRILSYLLDPVSPANLDEFLIITYTKAAAAELRGKIAARLTTEIAAQPNNRHLQKQLQRLYLTKISTVHAFCADILREYAYQLDIPADFRVAEESECLELQYAVLEKILDSAYENAATDADFCAFVDTQGFGRNDRLLPEIILKLYNSARCHMDPDGWMQWCLQACDVSASADVSETVWASYLIDDLHWYLDMQIQAFNRCIEMARDAAGMEKPVVLLGSILSQLLLLRDCNRWDDIRSHMLIDYGRLTFPKKDVDQEMADGIKAIREACKKGLQKRVRRFSDEGTDVLSDLANTAASVRGLVSLTRNFSGEYEKLKASKRVMDFGDLEHKTLDLLLGKKRYAPTNIAIEIGARFREVMVDEYQDSNAVQDAIFTALTHKRQNCFMVGDVKQSIYQFRLADPGIFLEKYNQYVPADTAVDGEGRKVHLSRNFRSSKAVIDAVNHVFSVCMSERVGGLLYGAEEMLYEGIPHIPLNEPEVELYGLQISESTYNEEANFIAKRVSELLDGTHMVRDGDSLRAIQPEDIAIILRSPGSVGRHYIDALAACGIRCHTDSNANLFEAEEVQTLRAILQCVDNPLQDIPLIAVLTSKVYGYSADDLASFRSGQRSGSIYAALQNDTSEKTQKFLEQLRYLRNQARTVGLTHLIKDVFNLTRIDSIYASFVDGDNRNENLLSLYKVAENFESGGSKTLSQFLIYLDALEVKGLPASANQSNVGAVTLMSIHKSKGLEFPVVILPGLSRGFNNESVYAQMLCDKDLGLGMSCVDSVQRVRYPSVAKRAIAAKMLGEGLSEEMRVLYVAMTRARDRLIMTYASKNIESELAEIALRAKFSDPVLLNSEVDCPGQWILLSAMKRAEAGAFFVDGIYPPGMQVSENPWLIKKVSDCVRTERVVADSEALVESITEETVSSIYQSLSFRYAHEAATKTPSKFTATQLKGRNKDLEAAENSNQNTTYHKHFRKPGFVADELSGTAKGNLIHTVMQHICYNKCTDVSGVATELERLTAEGYITAEQRQMINAHKIAAFFTTDVGIKLIAANNVLREFKFSVLEDADRYVPDVHGEKVLLQGVVDCAVIEDDGITVIDFKTDKVSAETVCNAAEQYREQVMAYARALSRIYQKNVKMTVLYFFEPEQIVTI